MNLFYKEVYRNFKFNEESHWVNVFVHYDIYKAKTFPKLLGITRYEKVSERAFQFTIPYTNCLTVNELLFLIRVDGTQTIEKRLERDEHIYPMRRKE